MLLILLFKFLEFYGSEFCSMVRKIFIYTAEEVKKLSPKVKLPGNEELNAGKPDVEVVVNTDDRSSIVGPGCADMPMQ